MSIIFLVFQNLCKEFLQSRCRRRSGLVKVHSLGITFGEAGASLSSVSGPFRSSQSTTGSRLQPFRLLPACGKTPRRLKQTCRKRCSAFANQSPRPANLPCSWLVGYCFKDHFSIMENTKSGHAFLGQSWAFSKWRFVMLNAAAVLYGTLVGLALGLLVDFLKNWKSRRLHFIQR